MKRIRTNSQSQFEHIQCILSCYIIILGGWNSNRFKNRQKHILIPDLHPKFASWILSNLIISICIMQFYPSLSLIYKPYILSFSLFNPTLTANFIQYIWMRLRIRSTTLPLSLTIESISKKYWERKIPGFFFKKH